MVTWTQWDGEDKFRVLASHPEPNQDLGDSSYYLVRNAPCYNAPMYSTPGLRFINIKTLLS